MDYVSDSPFYGNNMDESLAMAPLGHRQAVLLDSATHTLRYNPHAMVCCSLFEVAVVFEVTVESPPRDWQIDLIVVAVVVASSMHEDDGGDVALIVNLITMTCRNWDNMLS
jgi:hypothetical protein